MAITARYVYHVESGSVACVEKSNAVDFKSARRSGGPVEAILMPAHSIDAAGSTRRSSRVPEVARTEPRRGVEAAGQGTDTPRKNACLAQYQAYVQTTDDEDDDTTYRCGRVYDEDQPLFELVENQPESELANDNTDAQQHCPDTQQLIQETDRQPDKAVIPGQQPAAGSSSVVTQERDVRKNTMISTTQHRSEQWSTRSATLSVPTRRPALRLNIATDCHQLNSTLPEPSFVQTQPRSNDPNPLRLPNHTQHLAHQCEYAPTSIVRHPKRVRFPEVLEQGPSGPITQHKHARSSSKSRTHHSHKKSCQRETRTSSRDFQGSNAEWLTALRSALEAGRLMDVYEIFRWAVE